MVQTLSVEVAARTILIETDVTLRFVPGYAANQHVAQTTGLVTATTLIYS